MRKLPWVVWMAVISAGSWGSVSVLNEPFEYGYRTGSGLRLSTVFVSSTSSVEGTPKRAAPVKVAAAPRRPRTKVVKVHKRKPTADAAVLAFAPQTLEIQGQVAPATLVAADTPVIVPQVTYTVPPARYPSTQAQAGSGGGVSAARPPSDLVSPPPSPSAPPSGVQNGRRGPLTQSPAQAMPPVSVPPSSRGAPAPNEMEMAVPDLPMDVAEMQPPVVPTPPPEAKKPKKKKAKAKTKSEPEKPEIMSNQEVITEDAVKKSQEWIDSKDKFTYGEDGKIVYTYGVGMPVIVCAPLRITDLELQPGERVNGQIHAGDSTRWIISPAESGSGPDSITHLIIKPREAGLETNVIIPTDRRVYHLKFVSSEKNYVARVAFHYPEDVKRQWASATTPRAEDPFRTAAAGMGSTGGSAYGSGGGSYAGGSGSPSYASNGAGSMSTISPMFPERLFFDYDIEGNAPWKPVRVFDDGQKTFIQVPPEARNGEIPALMVVGADRSEQLVNYRFRDNYYVVDRIFDRAVLLIGVGREQQKITIERHTTRKGWAGSWTGGYRSRSGGD